MKKIVSFLLALVMILNLGITAFAEGTYTISLTTEDDTADVSEYVYVTVSGSQTITSPGAQACVEFDPEYLEYDESKSTIGTACSTFTAKAMNQAGHDYVSLAFQSLGSPIELAAGTWYTLAFKTLKAGNTTVSIWQKFVYDSSYAEITTTATDTVTFTITEPSTNVPVTGVTLNQTALPLGVGSSSTLTATVAPENATNKAVTWTTDNAEVATVADGVVTAVAEGTATITATTVDGGFTASCAVTVTAAATAEGYTVSMKDSSVTAAKGGAASVNVMVSGHSDENITGYNDYDVYVTYDSANLTFNKDASSAADTGATIEETETGTIRITGHGDNKEFSAAVATLNFTANTSGAHNVTITSAKVDNSGSAISNDAPDATVATETTVIKVPYSVTLPTDKGFSSEQTSVLPGESFTFTAPSDAAYYDITVEVGKNTVKPTISGNTYTITNVDGDVAVSAVGKTYDVTVADTTASVTAGNKAQYGVDYSFTVTASSGKVIESVTATVNGTPVTLTTSGGQYVIPGKSITGAVVIRVTEKDSGSTETTTSVTITGIDVTEIEGGALTQTVTVGQPFPFRLIKQSGYSYIVKVGGIEITPNEDGSYTIPGTMITAGGVTITIEKTLTPVAEVTVTNYIQLDGKVMWLITATAEDKVLAYGEEGTMFWSDQYDAYCWLVISAESEDAVKTAAQAAITEATESAVATTVAYDKDVNQTNAVDINDAQLTYDMYQAKAYEDFTNVSMDKFLEADVNADKTVNTEDAAAIVAVVLGK
ncbi:MAG: Ig-like domain-containing protein [Clostridiales bacterium]|nr:Ig-like domain-containing protein [Clostridiales bacterium]